MRITPHKNGLLEVPLGIYQANASNLKDKPKIPPLPNVLIFCYTPAV